MSEPEPPAMRAGHADREQVVTRLNAAFAEGRLDVAELDERVTAAYAAKTLGELVPLTADLPVPYQPPPASTYRPPAAGPTPDRRPAARSVPPGGPGAIDRAPFGGALAIFLVNVLIWAAVSVGTGDLIYFWPIWTAIPLLLLVVVGTVASRRRP